MSAVITITIESPDPAFEARAAKLVAELLAEDMLPPLWLFDNADPDRYEVTQEGLHVYVRPAGAG